MTANKKFAILTGVVATVFSTVSCAQEVPRYSHDGPALIFNIRVIDGQGNDPTENQDILVVDGKIAEIAEGGTLDAPDGAITIDGSGLTAMPGIIDMHAHVKSGWANASLPDPKYAPTYDDESIQQTLAGHLYSGVTTIYELGTERPEWMIEARDRINSGDLMGPRTFIVGAAWSQQPSGWEGAPLTYVTDLDSIPVKMQEYADNGIEMIKLYTGLSPYVAQFVVEEAHKLDITVVADFWQVNMDQALMMATGIDGWAHSNFNPVSDESNQWMVENNRFVIATANVGENLSGLRVADQNGSRAFLDNSLIRDIWGEETINEFYDVYPDIRHNFYEGPDSFYQKANFGEMTRIRKLFLENVYKTWKAGVLIAGGSDAPFPSVWAGESMHRELEMLVLAGIPPVEAIKACTYNAAVIMNREDEFGSLKIGLSADILIVEGNPAENISNTRNVQHVFLRGKQVDRNSLKLY